MASVLDTIVKRRSVRTYRPEAVEERLKNELRTFVRDSPAGPFGNAVRFSLLEVPPDEIKSLGTYGMIRGATLYLTGKVGLAPHAMEDFGYCMERAVLKATDLGLGTCWLGGSLDRGNFGRRVGLEEGEVIPAATPLGYPAEHPRLQERVVRSAIGARSRKPFGSLFFAENDTTPLEERPDDPVSRALDAVRRAPSASNRQPWRIVRRDGLFLFYMDEDERSREKYAPLSIQKIDLGIAMSHFELAWNELGRSGLWTPGAPKPETALWIPIATWSPR